MMPNKLVFWEDMAYFLDAAGNMRSIAWNKDNDYGMRQLLITHAVVVEKDDVSSYEEILHVLRVLGT